MRAISIAFALLVTTTSSSFASDYYQDSVKFHHEWKLGGSTWLERWSAMERRSSAMSDEEKIRRFSGILDAPVGTMSEEQMAMYSRIRKMLLDTPGHATYYLDKWKENPHHPATRFMFEYFRNLPSPETVGVLGELLADESPRPKLADDGSNAEEVLRAYPNCDKAVEVLSKLLQDPPLNKGYYNFPTDLPVWREWYERVKTGKETFRLVGDPADYTLRGPSKRGAIKPGSRNMKRTGLPPPANSQAALEPQRKAPVVLPYVIAGLFLLVSIFIYLRGKRKHD